MMCLNFSKYAKIKWEDSMTSLKLSNDRFKNEEIVFDTILSSVNNSEIIDIYKIYTSISKSVKDIQYDDIKAVIDILIDLRVITGNYFEIRKLEK